MSQTKAYVEAGYSAKTAPSRSSVLATRFPLVSARIQELTNEKAQQNAEALRMATERLAIDRAWILQELVDNVRRAKAAAPVLDQDGMPIGEFRCDLGAANKALELLGKELGMFVDRKMQVRSPLDDLALADLQALQDALVQWRT